MYDVHRIWEERSFLTLTPEEIIYTMWARLIHIPTHGLPFEFNYMIHMKASVYVPGNCGHLCCVIKHWVSAFPSRPLVDIYISTKYIYIHDQDIKSGV